MNPETPQPQPDQPVPSSTPQQAMAAEQEAVAPAVPSKIHAPGKSGSILAITEPGEVVVFRIKKHLFGLIVMYLQALIGFGLVTGLLLFTTADLVTGDNKAAAQQWIVLGLTVVGVLLFLILLVVTFVYRQNELLLTNRNITQVIRNGLFDRQVSQLTLNNIEDVTAEKKGIWAMIFNFGQIRVETAGEQNNFHFKYCPLPDHYGQLILDERASCRANSPPH